jgi:hypothetical protein
LIQQLELRNVLFSNWKLARWFSCFTPRFGNFRLFRIPNVHLFSHSFPKERTPPSISYFPQVLRWKTGICERWNKNIQDYTPS